jgi:hypothetical protein
VGVSHQSKITKRSQSAIDGGPMNSGSRSLCPGNNLLGCQVLIGAIENLYDRLPSSGHALMTVSQQGKSSLDARRS